MKFFLSIFLVVFAIQVNAAVGTTVDEETRDLQIRIAGAHANDKPVATPAATKEPAQPVNSRAAVYTTVDGKDIKGWLAWPADGETEGLPGLIVIHEWWGLNENIRKSAERLAGEGYIALAVDLYNGDLAATPKEAMGFMNNLNANAEAGKDNIAAAYDYLTSTMGASKVGIIGWCLGGQWSLKGALRLPTELTAAVIYYGAVTDDKELLKPLDMPMLGHFAGNDPIAPVKMAEAWRDAMVELEKDVTLHVYPNSKHGFSNPSGLGYDAEAADLSWERTTAFLAKHMQ